MVERGGLESHNGLARRGGQIGNLADFERAFDPGKNGGFHTGNLARMVGHTRAGNDSDPAFRRDNAMHRQSKRPYFLSFAWSFLISGLTAEQFSLPQPGDLRFANHERSKSVAATATIPRAMMVWRVADIIRNF